MKVLHRGLSIEMDADDARIPIIEALLFGRSLPPAFTPPKEPEKPPAPPVEIPEAMRKFWDALVPGERRELVRLTEKRWPAPELEAALGVSQRVLMGQHSRIGKLARHFKVPARVIPSGRNRKTRKYRVTAQAAAWLKALAAEPPPPPAPLF